MSEKNYLEFDSILPVEVPVKIGGKDYLIVEASADAIARYRNHIGKSAKLDRTGKVISIDGIADSEAYLVSLCLWEIKKLDDGSTTRIPVSLAVVKSWLHRVVTPIFEKCEEIHSLGKHKKKRSERAEDSKN